MMLELPTAHVNLDLNPQQAAIVACREGAFCVDAAAGTGKTRVVTERMIELVRQGTPLNRMLLVTFTVKAAEEMAARVHARTGRRPEWATNFHRLCTRLIRRFPQFGIAEGFTILSALESERLMQVQAREKLPCIDPKKALRMLQGQVDQARRHALWPEEHATTFEAERSPSLVDAADAFEQQLVERNALDFDKILHVVALGLMRQTDLAETVAGLWDYVMVDEAQDTDAVQLEIVKRIGTHGNVMMVGDQDQSLYRFRGAEPRNLNFFTDHFKAKVLPLSINYRSMAEILDVANAIIAGNPNRFPKVLQSVIGPGGWVSLASHADGGAEAAETVAHIRERIDAGVDPEEIAVLYRVGALSRQLEKALVAEGIPYRVAGSQLFWERREVKDLIAWAKVLLRRPDEEAYRRVTRTPPIGVGDAQWTKVTAAAHPEDGLRALPGAKVQRLLEALDGARRLGSPGGSLEALLESGGYLDYLVDSASGPEDLLQRQANVQEVLEVVRGFPSLADFHDELTLGLQNREERSGRKVTLSTIHAAKGLEWAHVFVVGVADGILPHAYSLQHGDGPDLEEERRILYVAITRAKEALRISYPVLVDRNGVGQYALPSRFLATIAPLMEQQVEPWRG